MIPIVMDRLPGRIAQTYIVNLVIANRSSFRPVRCVFVNWLECLNEIYDWRCQSSDLLPHHEIYSILEKAMYKDLDKSKPAILSCPRYLARVIYKRSA